MSKPHIQVTLGSLSSSYTHRKRLVLGAGEAGGREEYTHHRRGTVAKEYTFPLNYLLAISPKFYKSIQMSDPTALGT